ncbi:hypothetical protein [Paraburkholderia sacchari]|uniref:hypothetical protein n=1 Tax=Paraburkholderia sacchari TaxID=159450 RepID=UPI001BCEB57F|nr:hypothetical protein [Paraburkholderia sacchari]
METTISTPVGEAAPASKAKDKEYALTRAEAAALLRSLRGSVTFHLFVKVMPRVPSAWNSIERSNRFTGVRLTRDEALSIVSGGAFLDDAMEAEGARIEIQISSTEHYMRGKFVPVTVVWIG